MVIRELLDVDTWLLADREVLSAWGRASRNPVGLRNRFAAAGASSFKVSSFLRFDMKGDKQDNRANIVGACVIP